MQAAAVHGAKAVRSRRVKHGGKRRICHPVHILVRRYGVCRLPSRRCGPGAAGAAGAAGCRALPAPHSGAPARPAAAPASHPAAGATVSVSTPSAAARFEAPRSYAKSSGEAPARTMTSRGITPRAPSACTSARIRSDSAALTGAPLKSSAMGVPPSAEPAAHRVVSRHPRRADSRPACAPHAALSAAARARSCMEPVLIRTFSSAPCRAAFAQDHANAHV